LLRELRASLISRAPWVAVATLVSVGACIPDFASREDVLGPTTSSSSTTTSSTGGSAGQGGTGGAASSCTDGIANGDETDVDCGGSCGKCHLGKRCKTTSDCIEPSSSGGGGTGGAGLVPVVTCDSRHVCAPEARGHWISISDTSAPGPTMGHAMAFHAADRVVVLDGGSTEKPLPPIFQALVWRWDGMSWTTYPATETTPKIKYATLVYDADAERLLRFGGIDPTSTISNVLEDFDGVAFYPIGQTNPPGPRQFHGAAFDAARHQMVVFGGIDGGTMYGDTWVYDYASDTWTEKHPTKALHMSHLASLVYDAARQRVLIFGVEPGLSQTVLWDGNDWFDPRPVHAPSPRYPGAFAYDDRRERVILFGGLTTNAYVGDTWEWDGIDWHQTAMTATPTVPAPSARISSMAFDSNRGRAVLYGGSDADSAFEDTWEYFATANGCTADAQCDTDHCVDGLCCDVASCDSCYACSADVEHAGQCAPVLEGEKDPSSPCTCDGHGACQ
jgi:hypothetical protein